MTRHFTTTFFICLCLLLSGCGEEIDESPVDNTEDTNTAMAEQIYNRTGCRPSDVSKIKQLRLFKDSNGNKYLYGSKDKDETECFWFAKYDRSGNEIWEIIHKDNSFKSHAYNPVELKNGNIVIANVVMESLPNPIIVSPVIVDKDGNTNYLKVFNDNYIYSDVNVYDDFFFTTVSRQEMDLNKNAANRAAQIDNEGIVMRLFYGGTDQISLPGKGDKCIWLSDSTYVSMNFKNVTNSSIFKKTVWTALANIPSHESCEMNLSKTDTTIVASYFLKYADGSKDTIVYNLYKDSGKEVFKPVPLQGVYFSETDKILEMGEICMINPVFVPGNATNKKLKWESSDESVATVDSDGMVRTVSFGECNIYATSEDGGFVASCKITVLEPAIEDAIKVLVYGSTSSINGYTTGDVTAAFYNNSNKDVEVLEFAMYNTKTNEKVFYKTNCGFVKYRNPLKYDLKFELVYKPLYVWKYKVNGEIYTIKYQTGTFNN